MAVRSALRGRRSHEGETPGDASEGVVYDAFISYSHAVDGRLAPALQSALQRFSKPWYRLRALRIFRDNASLSANPALWTSIAHALERSRWFILLASPGSAQSPWVAREVESWLDRHGTERLLLAVTDGELAWDDAAGAFSSGPDAALPEVLHAAYEEEPRFIDLRWARTSEHLSLSDPRFRDAVADLAAPIHDRPKDDLVGEEVRQHRRAVRLARAAVATLVLLLCAAAVAAVLAVSQRNEARSQRDRAEAEARIATSRQLAAQASALRNEQYDLALLLAAEAYRTEATTEARSALTSTLESNPQLSAFVGPPVEDVALGFSPDGSLLAVVGEDDVALWNTTTHELVRRLSPAARPPGEDNYAPVAFSDDGTLVAAAWNGTATVWETATGTVRHTLTFALVQRPDTSSLAFGPGGTYLVGGVHDGLDLVEGTVVVWRLTDGSVQLNAPTRFVVEHVAIDDKLTTVTAGGYDGRMARFDLLTGAELETGHAFAPIRMSSSAHSADGRYYATANFEGDVTVYDLRTGAIVGQLEPEQRGAYGAMAFSRDGTGLAAAGEGIATVWSLDSPDGPLHLQGFSGITREIALSGDGSQLAVVGGTRIAHFDIDERFRLAEEVLEPDIYLPASVVRVAGVAFSGDGRFVAWLHPGTRPGEEPAAIQRVLVRRTEGRRLHADVPVDDPATALALSPDGRLLALGGEAVDIHALDGGAPRRLVDPGGEFVERLVFSPDGSLLTVVRRDGAIARYDLAAGEPVVEVEAPVGLPGLTVGVRADGGLVRLAGIISAPDEPVREADLEAPVPELRGVGEREGELGASPIGVNATAVGPGALRAQALPDGVVEVGGGPVERFSFQLAGGPTTLDFAQDGSLLVAAASNGSVVVWDVEEQAEVARLRVNDLGAEPIVGAFRPGGEPLVGIVAVDGSLTLWQVGTDVSLEEACKAAGRNLTEEEWQRYIGSIRPRSKTCPDFPLDE